MKFIKKYRSPNFDNRNNRKNGANWAKPINPKSKGSFVSIHICQRTVAFNISVPKRLSTLANQ